MQVEAHAAQADPFGHEAGHICNVRSFERLHSVRSAVRNCEILLLHGNMTFASITDWHRNTLKSMHAHIERHTLACMNQLAAVFI